MRFLDGYSLLDLQRFEILLDGLLTVEADFIGEKRFLLEQLSSGCDGVFGLAHPFSR